MTRLPQSFIEDRALRDAARAVLTEDIERLRASLSEEGIASRVSSGVSSTITSRIRTGAQQFVSGDQPAEACTDDADVFFGSFRWQATNGLIGTAQELAIVIQQIDVGKRQARGRLTGIMGNRLHRGEFSIDQIMSCRLSRARAGLSNRIFLPWIFQVPSMLIS